MGRAENYHVFITADFFSFQVARDSGRNAEERYDLGTNLRPPRGGCPTQLPTRGER